MLAVGILSILLFQDLSEVDFPSITLCNEHGLDSGQYVRNVFNNLDFIGNQSAKLKEGFTSIIMHLTRSDYVYQSELFYNYINWMRYTLLVKIDM